MTADSLVSAEVVAVSADPGVAVCQGRRIGGVGAGTTTIKVAIDGVTLHFKQAALGERVSAKPRAQ